MNIKTVASSSTPPALLVLSALLALGAAYPSHGNDESGGGLRKPKPCPYASEFGSSLSDELKKRRRFLLEGLLNEGNGCWGNCGSVPGDCPSYCGTGQCCRLQDYENGVLGCELAHAIESGSRCGAWAGDPPVGLRNEGEACSGKCPDGFGADCAYCGGWDGVPDGSGQCCRVVDGERGVPGCELAAVAWPDPDGPASQCGAFKDANGPGPSPPTPPASGPPSPTSPPVESPTPNPPTTSGGLMNEGLSCEAECGLTGDNWGPTRDCPHFCGTGKCCARTDWRRGAFGCELAENVTGPAVCGDFEDPHPTPADFRPGAPRGVYPTPPDVVEEPFAVSAEGRWIKDIVADGSGPMDHSVPAYDGDGGQPWSPFEMVLVRDLLTHQMRQASAGLDELSTAKFVRLPFHDCLHYAGDVTGIGGCDGCINWDNVGFRHEGRVEERNYEDHERPSPSSVNNGLGDAVEFLEYVYNLDLGKTWASGCYLKPGSVSGNDVHLANTRYEPITVNSIEECRDHCDNTTDCGYFTVPHFRAVNGHGPCRLFNETGSTLRLSGGNGRLIAADAYCETAESWSLKSRGKSRADLWAFASLVAVEEGIQRHNWACGGDRRSPHNGPIMCTQFEGEDQCDIELPRPFVFKTGRKDCDPDTYKTDKKENAPDEHFNGTMTVRFMEDNFAFSAKETVTIMGAHTVGRFHQRQTGHKYVWTTDFQAFNNQYYRNVAGKPDWFFDDDECTRVGDAWGNKGHAVWIAKMNQVYRTGAPIQWIQKKVVCPNCADRSYERGGRNPWRLEQDRDCCLNNVPAGAQCRPDGGVGRPQNSTAFDFDDDFSDGCEYSHFIFGRDEAAMGSDMGLRYKFDVDVRGFPHGCPGLGTFYPSGFRFSDETCGIDGRPRFVDPTLAWNDTNAVRVTKDEWTDRACPADCARQDYRYPGDGRTLADWVDLYAEDQAAWIREFVPVMEKMINNGYDDSELVITFSGANSPA